MENKKTVGEYWKDVDNAIKEFDFEDAEVEYGYFFAKTNKGTIRKPFPGEDMVSLYGIVSLEKNDLENMANLRVNMEYAKIYGKGMLETTDEDKKKMFELLDEYFASKTN